MQRLRTLFLAALASGALAGLLLFAVQHVVMVPLILTAETYEDAAEAAQPATDQHAHDHAAAAWQPAEGLERTVYTALASVLSGIGFAALLLGAVALSGRQLDLRRGLLWGAAGFLCFALAPALGLPPKPPGAAVGDLAARQLWWLGTALATAGGLWLIAAWRSWPARIGGVALLLLPHLIGAPLPVGEDLVPAALQRQFALASVASSAVFWLALGAIGGALYRRLLLGAPLAAEA